MEFFWGCMFLLLATCVPYTPTGTPTSEPTLTIIPSPVALTKQSPTSTNIPNPTQTEIVEDNVTFFKFDQLKPLPGESNLIHGKVFLDSVEIKESLPASNTVVLLLRGSLPTPCSTLRAKIELPDPKNKIAIDIYSLQNPDVMCIQSLAPFKVELPVANLMDGRYSVEINKLQKIQIDWP